MLIEKISNEDHIPYHLLLLADETTDAINKYIHDSGIYTAKENAGGEPIGVYVLQRKIFL
jgi:aminoglycoside 6'-N-acetyltransferase I